MRSLARLKTALIPSCLAVISLILGGCVPEEEVQNEKSRVEKSPAIYGFAVNDEQTTLATYGIDRMVQIRNLSDNELIATLQLPDLPPRCVTFVGLSDVLVGYVDGSVMLWTFRSGKYFPRLIGRHGDIVRSCQVGPDKSFAITADLGGGVTIWDVKNGWKRKTDFRVKGGLCAARISPDGKHIAVACPDGRVQLWAVDEPTKARYVRAAHKYAVLDVAFSPNGDTLATAGKGGTIRLWNSSDLSVKSRVNIADEYGRFCYGIRRICFSPDGLRIAAIAHLSTTVVILDSKTRKVVQRISEHAATVSEIGFRSNEMLLTTGYDGQICTVDVPALLAAATGRSGEPQTPRLTSHHESLE